MAQVCSSFLPQSLIHEVERLYIREEGHMTLKWQDDLEGSQWLEPLHPFMGVKHLHLSGKVAPCIVSSFQDLVGPRTTHQYSYKFLFSACYNLSQLVPAIKACKLQDRPAMSDFLKVQLIFCFTSDGKRCQEHKTDKVSKFSNFGVIN